MFINGEFPMYVGGPLTGIADADRGTRHFVEELMEPVMSSLPYTSLTLHKYRDGLWLTQVEPQSCSGSDTYRTLLP
jgi:hypothetical protein